MSSVLMVGVWGMQPHFPHPPPVVLELGFISKGTDPYKETLFWSGNVRMAPSDFDFFFDRER